jgi:hypothetical protein
VRANRQHQRRLDAENSTPGRNSCGHTCGKGGICHPLTYRLTESVCSCQIASPQSNHFGRWPGNPSQVEPSRTCSGKKETGLRRASGRNFNDCNFPPSRIVPSGTACLVAFPQACGFAQTAGRAGSYARQQAACCWPHARHARTARRSGQATGQRGGVRQLMS